MLERDTYRYVHRVYQTVLGTPIRLARTISHERSKGRLRGTMKPTFATAEALPSAVHTNGTIETGVTVLRLHNGSRWQ